MPCESRAVPQVTLTASRTSHGQEGSARNQLQQANLTEGRLLRGVHGLIHHTMSLMLQAASAERKGVTQ